MSFLGPQTKTPPANRLGFKGVGEGGAGAGGAGGGIGSGGLSGMGGSGGGEGDEDGVGRGLAGKTKDLPWYSGDGKNKGGFFK